MQRNRKRYALLVAVIFLAAALLPATALGSTPPQSSTGPSIAGGVSDLSVTVTPPTEPGTPATIHISVTGEPSTGLSMGWAVGALRPADGYTVIPVRDGSGSFRREIWMNPRGCGLP